MVYFNDDMTAPEGEEATENVAEEGGAKETEAPAEGGETAPEAEAPAE